MTHLDRLLQQLAALRSEAIRISGRDHEPNALATLLKDAGGTLETFFKAHVFPGSDPTLFNMINQLPSVGVNAVDIPAFHNLRNAYNSAKHNAAYVPDVDSVVSALNGARTALSAWRGQGIGSTESIASPMYRRRVWIASWDHFVHGDGEVHVVAPVDESDVPRTVDTIYVKGLAYPDVLGALGSRVRPGSGIIPQKFIDEWASEGDFADAYVFDGEYRDLLSTLVGEELRLDLMPSLKRESDPIAMRTALAFAAVDVAREPSSPNDEDELRAAILVRALTDYAAPDSAPLSQKFAEVFSKLLVRIPRNERQRISGPRFFGESDFERANSAAIVGSTPALISSTYELVLLL